MKDLYFPLSSLDFVKRLTGFYNSSSIQESILYNNLALSYSVILIISTSLVNNGHSY